MDRVRSTPWGHTCPDLLWQPGKAETAGAVAGVADFGRSRKWGYRGGPRLGFKLKAAARRDQRQCRTRDGGQCRTMRGDNARPCGGGRGVKGLSLVGHEEAPCGLGLRSEDRGSNSADGAGDHGRPPRRAQMTERNREPCAVDFCSFPSGGRYFRMTCSETGLPGQSGKGGLCVFVGVLRDFGVLRAKFCHYPEPV